MSERVCVLTTGGTIASRDSARGVVVHDHGDTLVPGLAGRLDIEIEVREVLLAHGFRLAPADIVEIARQVTRVAHEPEVSGVVVTHGTDTMEESAYLADLVHSSDVPIVFTGAQRHADEPEGDGPRNLTDAVRLAASGDARGLGVVIAMAGRAYDARTVTKVHTMALDAFAAPGYGPVAHIFRDRVSVTRYPRRPERFRLEQVGRFDARVDIVPLHPGADGRQLAAARLTGARGVVLQAFGAGNATPAVVDEVAACTAAGLVVLVVSRSHQGHVAPIYGNGGGVDLQTAGAVFGGDLRAPKAWVLLTAALSADQERPAAIARLQPQLWM